MMGRKRIDTSRDGGGFVALPWSVLDSQAYRTLSHPAKALLLEVARQYVRDNNGRLLLSMRHLRTRGWSSADVVQRAKSELLDTGLLFETVKGCRPNKASWYAVTWCSLDRSDAYDPGAERAFERGAYRKNAALIPPAGTDKPAIAPASGTGKATLVPPPGTIKPTDRNPPIPPDGNHLDMPSTAVEKARQSYGEWISGFMNRLAALGPNFSEFCPVADPSFAGGA